MVQRAYLTSRINSVFRLIVEMKRVSEGDKKENPEKISGLSSVVAGRGLEPLAFGL